MPLLRRKRVFAAATESTAGTAESLDATDGVYNCYDLQIQPGIAMGQREGQAGFGMLSAIPGMRVGTATFRTDIAWDGTATLPNWAEILLPACGWVKTSTTFNPTTEAPGSNVKTLTIGAYIDGVFKSIFGAMGNFQIICPTGRTAQIQWTFQGAWATPSDVALIAPTYPTVVPIRYASATTQFNSNNLCLENLTFNSGNTLTPKVCPDNAAGLDYFLATNRQPTATGNPESSLVATTPHYTDLLTPTEAELTTTLDGISTSTIELSMPKAQIQSISEADRDGLVVDNITWQGNKNGTTADQELQIIFTATA